MINGRDLAHINQFIDEFDPQKFTTNKDLVGTVDKILIQKRAKQFKARLHRKRQMKQKFREIDFSEQYNANDDMISQEQIDELLNKI